MRKRVEPASADDVFGDVMLRLVQHRAELQAAEKPIAWVLRVAANAIADYYRRREVEQRAEEHVTRGHALALGPGRRNPGRRQRVCKPRWASP